jgi:hypothetical protein
LATIYQKRKKKYLTSFLKRREILKKQYFRILIITLFVIPMVLFSTNPISISLYSSRNENQDESNKLKFDKLRPSFANAWLSNGTAICTANYDQWTPQICSDGDGGAIITWEDHRRVTESDIYCQRVDSSGNILWDIDGLVICNASEDQEVPHICSDGAGGAFITWQDYRNLKPSVKDIYAQRVDLNGIAFMKSINGRAICTEMGPQVSPLICSDGAGGAIITWEDYRNYESTSIDIYAQRINPEVNVQWTDNGTVICTEIDKQIWPRICSDGAGGAIITWNDNRSANFDIYVQRIDLTGNTKWTDHGIAICTESHGQYYPRICSDGAGGAIITWEDRRSGKQIYAQRIDSNGNTMWTDHGIRICPTIDTQSSAEICSDGAGGAIITWEDTRITNPGLYAQRINSTGNIQWDDGIVICSTGGNRPLICSDGAGGAIITWTKLIEKGEADIYAQKVDFSGNVQWKINGVAICTEKNYQGYPNICGDGAGGGIFTWSDCRLGGTHIRDIYAQRIKEHPLITINLPINNQLFEMTPPSFSIEIVEINLDTKWYTIDEGNTNKTIPGLTGQIDPTEWNKKGNGTVTIEFYSNDTFGNIGSAEVTVHKDIDAPIITINYPDPDQTFGISAPLYDLSIEEGNLYDIWYTLDGGATNISITELSGIIEESIWEGVPQGSATIRFYASDTLGHIGFEEISVIKRVSGEKGNFWEELLQQGILIPIVGAIVGGIVGIFVKITYSRMKKKKALRKSNKT